MNGVYREGDRELEIAVLHFHLGFSFTSGTSMEIPMGYKTDRLHVRTSGGVETTMFYSESSASNGVSCTRKGLNKYCSISE